MYQCVSLMYSFDVPTVLIHCTHPMYPLYVPTYPPYVPTVRTNVLDCTCHTYQLHVPTLRPPQPPPCLFGFTITFPFGTTRTGGGLGGGWGGLTASTYNEYILLVHGTVQQYIRLVHIMVQQYIRLVQVMGTY